MKIKQIKLENIRSYVNEEINFPDNSLMLSGDIGSGKSTILLAIEFALFGLRGKQLSGSSLLRNGKQKGSVELKFIIDKKEIIIKRVLKRTKDSVVQDAGYYVIDGIKHDKTAIELKTFIINLLGYPKDLLTKTKNLIYRFTVYTPQEEMKSILSEDVEQRLDTLRKVFGIDKYKRICENTENTIKSIKTKIKENQIMIQDLEEKTRLKENKSLEIIEINNKLDLIIPEFETTKNKVLEQKNKIESIESSVKRFNELNNRLSILETDLRNKLEQRKRNSERIILLHGEVDLIKKGFKEITDENITELIKEKEKQIIELRNEIKEINKKINESETNKNYSVRIKNQIVDLDKCPTCHQEVSQNYKVEIGGRENIKIKDFDEIIIENKNKLNDFENKLNMWEQEVNILRKKETEIKVNQVKIQNIKNKESELVVLNQQNVEIKKLIGSINLEKIELNKEIGNLKDINEQFVNQRKILDEVNEQLKKVEIEKTRLEEGKLQIEKSVDELNKEIERKIIVKEKIIKDKEIQNWLENFFVKLMREIERQIMVSAHGQFNELFEQWFNMLMEDETINIRLDDSFTPVVEQNGYEASLEHLSGGERTAAALAYRLSLNKVINNMMTEIKTKGLIILDEPTDGFSSEQLDRVRDVIEQINADQIIMVSHESKIESFVDEVIRINKNEHVSNII